jgi:flagellar assembly factor FliW
MADIRVNTRFGELSIDSSQIITFPRGIPGFETSTRWKLFHEVDEQGNWVSGVVVHLQSLDDAAVSLPLTDPTLFGFNYDLMLTDGEMSELAIEDPNDVMVLMTLSAREGAQQNGGGKIIENMYANIAAPILINSKSRIGMQKIMAGNESRVDFRPAA